MLAWIREWLARHDVTEIDYKAHPKDPAHELRHPDYHLIDPTGALETYLASTNYDFVIGVRSSALLFARQIYPQAVEVVAFGWDRVRFKSKAEQNDMKKTFLMCGVKVM